MIQRLEPHLIEKIHNDIYTPLYNPVKLYKKDIVKLLPKDLLKLVWSCREPIKGKPCNRCKSCLYLNRAIENARN
jgi:7-cyano-7-deazaguanine synthase in queuosine biosynthesis